MARRLAVAIAAGLFLGGCCHDGLGYSAWHSSTLAEFGPAPKPLHVKRAKARNPSKPVMTSSEDSSASDDSADEELRRKLVICRGCEQPGLDDQANSIWPKRPADGYYLTVDEVSNLLPGQPILSGRRR